MAGRLKARLSRVKKLEISQRRFACPQSMSDDDLMVAAFGYDTPELHAAQALRAKDEDAFLEMMLGEVRREIALRKARGEKVGN